MSKNFGIGIVSVLLIVLGVWVWQSRYASQDKDAVETIRIATSQTGLLIWIALDKGYFTSQGLDVKVEEVQGGTLAMKKVLAGEADISASSEFTLVAQSFNHADLQVVATISSVDTIGLTIRKDRGIERLSDLNGKKIGVTLGSAGEFFLRRFLVLNQLSVNEVELTPMSPGKIMGNLIAGNIDAGFTWEPNNYKMKESLGEIARYFPGQNDQDFHFILTGKSEWVETHQSALRRMLKALIQAEQFARDNKSEAQQLLIQRFKSDPSFLVYLWGKHNLTITLPQSLLTVMDDAAQWRITNKLTDQTKIPNYLDFISFEALDEVRPKTITIIH